MRVANTRMNTSPVPYRRSKRTQDMPGMTSGPAGKVIPLAAIPMLREDQLSGSLTISCDMLETQDLLANKVYLNVTAWCVPLLALERFNGSRDLFDKSYGKKPLEEGGAVVPFIETHAMGAHGANAVYVALGMQGAPTDQVNTSYLEAYNLIHNFRRKNIAKDLPLRARLDGTLAPAFWVRGRFDNVVPDFDQAVMAGEVALNVTSENLPVRQGPGAGRYAPVATAGSQLQFQSATGGGGARNIVLQAGSSAVGHSGGAVGSDLPVDEVFGLKADLQNVYAQLQQNGITVSLAEIDRARKLQAFAKLRERYTGWNDDRLINMLMNGLTIPEQHLKQPMFLANQVVTFDQSLRYATNAPNLAESATSGGVRVTIPLRVPRLSTGGIVMVLAEAVPAQLFERQQDPWFHTGDVDELPEAMRDFTDPEKVDIITNGMVDTDHSNPNATFGYAPLNWKWTSFGPRIGGKFYRPEVDAAIDEERRRFWAAEMIDPALSADFYEVPPLHQKPFLDTESDPFEFSLAGSAGLTGLTQFGPVLHEAEDNYDAVDAATKTDLIDKE